MRSRLGWAERRGEANHGACTATASRCMPVSLADSQVKVNINAAFQAEEVASRAKRRCCNISVFDGSALYALSCSSASYVMTQLHLTGPRTTQLSNHLSRIHAHPSPKDLHRPDLPSTRASSPLLSLMTLSVNCLCRVPIRRAQCLMYVRSHLVRLRVNKP